MKSTTAHQHSQSQSTLGFSALDSIALDSIARDTSRFDTYSSSQNSCKFTQSSTHEQIFNSALIKHLDAIKTLSWLIDILPQGGILIEFVYRLLVAFDRFLHTQLNRSVLQSHTLKESINGLLKTTHSCINQGSLTVTDIIYINQKIDTLTYHLNTRIEEPATQLYNQLLSLYASVKTVNTLSDNPLARLHYIALDQQLQTIILQKFIQLNGHLFQRDVFVVNCNAQINTQCRGNNILQCNYLTIHELSQHIHKVNNDASEPVYWVIDVNNIPGNELNNLLLNLTKMSNSQLKSVYLVHCSEQVLVDATMAYLLWRGLKIWPLKRDKTINDLLYHLQRQSLLYLARLLNPLICTQPGVLNETFVTLFFELEKNNTKVSSYCQQSISVPARLQVDINILVHHYIHRKVISQKLHTLVVQSINEFDSLSFIQESQLSLNINFIKQHLRALTHKTPHNLPIVYTTKIHTSTNQSSHSVQSQPYRAEDDLKQGQVKKCQVNQTQLARNRQPKKTLQHNTNEKFRLLTQSQIYNRSLLTIGTFVDDNIMGLSALNTQVQISQFELHNYKLLCVQDWSNLAQDQQVKLLQDMYDDRQSLIVFLDQIQSIDSLQVIDYERLNGLLLSQEWIGELNSANSVARGNCLARLRQLRHLGLNLWVQGVASLTDAALLLANGVEFIVSSEAHFDCDRETVYPDLP